MKNLTRRDALKRGGAAAVVLPMIAIPATANAGDDPVIGLVQDWLAARDQATQASDTHKAAEMRATHAYPRAPDILQHCTLPQRVFSDATVEPSFTIFRTGGPYIEEKFRAWFKADHGFRGLTGWTPKQARADYNRHMRTWRRFQKKCRAVDQGFNLSTLERRAEEAWARTTKLEHQIIDTTPRTLHGLAAKMQMAETIIVDAGLPDNELDWEPRIVRVVARDAKRLAGAMS